MSGGLIGGIIGAAAGFFIGGPAGAAWGWTLGSLAGNLLDPPKQEGPRLGDTKVRGADYGVMRPIVYGTMRVGGVGMGQGSTSDGPNKFTEHKEKNSGKGGGGVTTYTYSLSFFNEICEGPIEGVLRRWANGRLITDITNEENWPYRLYFGDATQMPDPTMETIYGVGEVTPMRGVCYEAVEELDVTDYGNARPNVEYEVFTEAGPYPWRYSTFDSWPEGSPGNVGGQLLDGIITTCRYTSVAGHYYEHQFLLDGTDLEQDLDVPIAFATTGEGFLQTVVLQLAGVAVYNSYNHPSLYGWYKDYTASIEIIGTIPHASAGSIYQDGACYSYNNGDIISYAMINADPDPFATNNNASYSLDAVYANSAIKLGTSDDGHVWVAVASVQKLWKLDAELNLVHFWDTGDWDAVIDGINLYPFHVYKDQLCFDNGGIAPRGKSLVRVNDDWSFTFIGSVAASAGPCITLRGGLVLVSDGVISLDPPAVSAVLGDIVSDQLQRGGLDVSQIDVSDLTQPVPGIVFASQATIHNNIQTLRDAYFFDVTEFDGKVVGVNRGHDAIATIPDGDLAAHVPGSEPPEPLEVTRIPESELPRTVFVKFYDREHDYQPGSVFQRRQTTSSEFDTTKNLPIALNATEAVQIAQWHLHFAWLEREHYAWTTSIKWSALTPTDVVVVRGINIRITNKVETPDGLIKFEGVRAFGGPFSPSAGTISGGIGGSDPGGQDPPVPPGLPVETELVLLDIPVLTQDAAPFGFYAAMGPAREGKWTGATLYKSGDEGSTWVAIAEQTSASIIGATTGALDDYLPVEYLDETSTVDVVMTVEDSTLSSVDEAALATGANLCAIRSGSGWEILQFRDAVLTAPRTYTLSGFWRGRKDSEDAIAGHLAGDTFVLLSTAINVDAPEEELNVPLLYKAVTFGTALADAVQQEFTNTGEGSTSWHDTIANNLPIYRVDHTGTSYSFVETDRGKLHTFNNAATVTVNLNNGLKDGWWVFVENLGAGDVVLDPVGTSPAPTIDGSGSSLTLETDQGIFLQTDGANFGTSRGIGGGSNLIVKEEGSNITTAASSINFTGSAVTASAVGTDVTVNVAPALDDPPYGHPYSFVVPLASAFGTTVGAITSVADKTYRLQVVTPSLSATLKAILKASPTPPYTIDICFGINAGVVVSNSIICGIAVSDGTKLQTILGGVSAGKMVIAVQRWNNNTTVSSTQYIPDTATIDLARIYLRMTHDNSTHRTFAFSSNGLDYMTIVDESPTVHLTESLAGIGFLSAVHNSGTAKYSIFNYKITSSVLGDAA